MNDRETAHALLDEFSDAELEEVVRLLRVQREEAEPEMAELPASWRYLPSGEPAPNWVAAVDEARRDLPMPIPYEGRAGIDGPRE
jgi:hypothetical protein